MTSKKANSSKGSVLKAGLWYTLCNVIVRGINFLTTPLFTRLMSKGEFGLFSNYASWLSLLAILTTMDLSTSIARAKLDYKDDLDGYISSIQVLGTISTAVCYAIVCVFSSFFTKLFQMDMIYIHIMFLYLLVSPAFNILQEKHRQLLKYKLVSLLTIISTLLSMIVSVILVLSYENKLLGRVIGNTVVLMCICIVIYFYNIYKGRRVSLTNWKYAIAFSGPLIAHALAGNALATSDRIIITNICGAEQTALYSIVYSCASIVFLVGSSINQAWTPWFYQQMEQKEYLSIRKATRQYLLIAFFLLIYIMLLGPELVLIFGGKGYIESVYILPVIIVGCYYWILYTFFINIQLFHKKTIGITIKTIIAAAFNIITNIVFIKMFGYQAAAYTTLASYLLLFFLHYNAGIRMEGRECYDNKLFVRYVIFSGIALFGILLTYKNSIIRYGIIIAYSIVVFYFAIRNKGKIICLVKKILK